MVLGRNGIKNTNKCITARHMNSSYIHSIFHQLLNYIGNILLENGVELKLHGKG